ncbi:hypothetical protein ACKFKF_27980 [Phormidesmis sp. 146-12]
MDIFGWFAGADADDFPEDSDERLDAALKTAGTTAPVETFITDWGHYDGDHSENEHAKAWEHTDVDSTDRDYILYDRDKIDDLPE